MHRWRTSLLLEGFAPPLGESTKRGPISITSTIPSPLFPSIISYTSNQHLVWHFFPDHQQTRVGYNQRRIERHQPWLLFDCVTPRASQQFRFHWTRKIIPYRTYYRRCTRLRIYYRPIKAVRGFSFPCCDAKISRVQ